MIRLVFDSSDDADFAYLLSRARMRQVQGRRVFPLQLRLYRSSSLTCWSCRSLCLFRGSKVVLVNMDSSNAKLREAASDVINCESAFSTRLLLLPVAAKARKAEDVLLKPRVSNREIYRPWKSESFVQVFGEATFVVGSRRQPSGRRFSSLKGLLRG